MSTPEDTSTEPDRDESAEVPAEEHPLEWDEAPNNRKPAEEREAISTRAEKDDARSIVTGEAKYTSDYRTNFQDLAEGKVLRSEIPHGRVEHIDTSGAEAMDGVYAVITPWSDEVPDRRYTSAGQSYPEPSPWDMRVLRRTVRYVGDPVAAVAALAVWVSSAATAATGSPTYRTVRRNTRMSQGLGSG